LKTFEVRDPDSGVQWLVEADAISDVKKWVISQLPNSDQYEIREVQNG